MENITDVYNALKEHKDYDVTLDDRGFIIAQKGSYKIWADEDQLQFYKGKKYITHTHAEWDFQALYADIVEFLDQPEEFVKEMKRENVIINAVVILLGIIVVIFSALH